SRRKTSSLPAATSTTRCCAGGGVCCGCRGHSRRRRGGARGADVLLVLPISIAWTVDDDDVAVVEQAVDEGRGAEVIAEVVAPGFPRDVAGDDGRALL